MEPTDCPETSVSIYHSSLHNIPNGSDLIYIAAEARSHA